MVGQRCTRCGSNGVHPKSEAVEWSLYLVPEIEGWEEALALCWPCTMALIQGLIKLVPMPDSEA